MMKHLKLIQILNDCVIACNHCADACLDEENVAMMAACIRTDRACAEVCQTASKLLASGFYDVSGLIAYCKALCEACAEECSMHDHQHCQDCAAACKACAVACDTFELSYHN